MTAIMGIIVILVASFGIGLMAQDSYAQGPKNEESTKKRRKQKVTRGIQVIPYDTFVQPGVSQKYTFITSLPITASFAQVWSSFEYAQSPSGTQKLVIRLSRALGLVQFSLHHITEPHTVERLFKIQ